MTSITLNEILEKEAWINISSRMPISLDMLEKYADKLDWRAISRNGSIDWTIDALQKFADKLDWDEFSITCPEHLICECFLLQFCDRWNWAKLSRHSILYKNRRLLEKFWDLLEKFADKVNWSEITGNASMFPNPQVFFERFRQYIPMDALLGSSLWFHMIDARSEALWLELGGEKTAEF